MAALITYDQVKEHLRLPDDAEIPDIARKMDQATAIVRKMLNEGIADDWTDETDPADDDDFAIVQAIILDVFANLFGYRGDGDKPVEGPVTARMKELLIATGLMDPTLA